jgi:hypothetical protein
VTSLRRRRLRIWCDDDLPAGEPVHRTTDGGLKGSHVAIVCVGRAGVGTYQQWESFDEAIHRGMNLITVLLPGVTREVIPDLPFPLRRSRPVIFNELPTEQAALDDIEWGITGRRPEPSDPQKSRRDLPFGAKRAPPDSIREPLDEPRTFFRCLHITDLHFGESGMRDLWPNVQDQFFDDLRYLLEKIGFWDLVLFTGDLVQQGRPDEFVLVDQLLARMWGKFAEWGFEPKLLAVPGNHDLVRPTKANPTLLSLTNLWERDAVSQPFWTNPKSAYRRLINTAFSNYRSWWEQTKIPKLESYVPGMLLGDFSATIEKGRLKFGIVGLNSAFLHLSDGVQGKLALDIRQFNEASAEE